ncbi:MAG: hypothetical protein ACRD2L_03855, partial [Terriglobia bacterium]
FCYNGLWRSHTMNAFVSKMSSECFKAADKVRFSRVFPFGRELLTDPAGRPLCAIGHVLAGSGVKITDPTLGPALVIEDMVGKRPPDTLLSTMYQVMTCNDGLRGAARRGGVSANLRKLGKKLQQWGDLL